MKQRTSSSRLRFREYLAKRRADKDYVRRGGLKDLAPKESGAKEPWKRARSFFTLFRSFWAFTGRTPAGGVNHRPWIYLALLTLTITTLLGLGLPASTKIAIDYVLLPEPGPEGLPGWLRRFTDPWSREQLLWALSAAMILLSVVTVSLGLLGRWQVTRVTKRVQVQLRTSAFERASRLPLHRLQHYKSGGIASLLREDAGTAGELLFSLIYNPWRAIVQLAGTLVILAWVDWKLLAGATMLLPAVWLTHRTWIAQIRPLYRDAKNVRQSVDATATEVFAGVRVVRGFSRERAESARFTAGQHYMTRIEIVTWWWSRIVEIAWSVLIPTASAGVMVYGGTQVLRGSLTIGDVMMFSAYLLMLLGPLESLTSSAAAVQSNLAAMDRVLDLLAEPEEFADRPGTALVEPGDIRGDVQLSGVWFTYPKSGRRGGGRPGPESKAPSPPTPPDPVIRGVSLSVRAGEVVAFVGASGSGKTTLCNLIARFYDPDENAPGGGPGGSILLDGRNIREIDVRSYRGLLGIVEQDVLLFDGTIAQNIAYGRRDATPEQIVRAAQDANAHEFITGFDDGYATVVGERGVRLSGGQRQRIAIARAILADPRILILDEATSNLDSESELLIQQSLTRLMKGRTSFVIAHRLSTIRHADRIVVLDKGTVIESGSHDELLARGGRYADLLRLQVEGRPPQGGQTPAVGGRGGWPVGTLE